MEIDLHELLAGNFVLLIFLVIGTGYLIGNIRLGSINLGSTTGVLLAGLLFGHLGFEDSPMAATFGFTLFIFSVGLQAGPRFFSVFMEDGAKYLALSFVVALTGVGLTLVITRLFTFDYGMSAGLLAGALTSTPTLAGAQDAITSGLATIPAGLTAREAAENVSIGYAITYIFGTIGLIVFIRYLPLVLRIDLPTEARRLADERGLSVDGTTGPAMASGTSLPLIRAYRIPEDRPLVGKSLREFGNQTEHHFVAQRIRRGDELLDADPDLVVQAGDIISVVARLSDHRNAQENVGQEVLDPALIAYEILSREIVVIHPGFTGKTLAHCHVTSEYGCFPTAIIRSGIRLPPDENLLLTKGDRLVVTGEKERLQALAERIGHIDEEIEETDLLTFSFGVVGGLVLGTVLVKLGTVSIGLGSAGGLLLLGIMIGFLRSIHPTFGRVPRAAQFILMELGLMLFMASVGLKAGAGVIEALASVGPTMILCGIVVTMTPVVVGYVFGRTVLKLNPALLLGSIAGAMTSTPALNVVNEAARSPLPALGYAGTYTFANVILTFAGTLLMAL